MFTSVSSCHAQACLPRTKVVTCAMACFALALLLSAPNRVARSRFLLR